jgi:predicted metal-dependent hydrolase
MRKEKAPRKERSAVPRCEPLKIEGRAVDIKVKLNPRARRLIVKVHPTSGEVSVIAPSRRALDRAIDFARGETDWIARQIARVPQRVMLRPGARIPLRGTSHLIVQGEATVSDEAIIHIGGRLEHAPRRIADYLKREARRDLEARTATYAAVLGVHPKHISLRDTKSRWGSCSASRNLSFSWRLILAPSFVLDYVAAHETAHLREMNHGAEFWKLVRGLIDDIEKPQNWLKRRGADLHRYAL